MTFKPVPLALLGLMLIGAQAKSEPTWVSAWQQLAAPPPGSVGEALRMNRESADVDVKSIVKSKGIAYFRWRYFIASNGNSLCRIDYRVCDGVGAAVKCSTNQFLMNGQWAALSKRNANDAFIAAARLACDF
jgi:hypothetical protein